MNEAIFVFHILLVVSFGLFALRLGKEALFAWISLQAVLANLFVIKQINFLGYEVTGSDVFAIGSILGLNLLQEYFGKESAKKATWVCFFILAFFGVMSQVHLFYQPSIHDIADPSFHTILTPAPRLLLASVTVFFIVQQIDRRFFGLLKKKSSLSLSMRNGVCLTFSQLIDTVLFSVLGLYGQVASLTDIILISFLIKVIVIFSMTTFISFTKRMIPNYENS